MTTYYNTVAAVLCTVFMLAVILLVTSSTDQIEPPTPNALEQRFITCVNGFAHMRTPGYSHEFVLLLNKRTKQPLTCDEILAGEQVYIMSLKEYSSQRGEK